MGSAPPRIAAFSASERIAALWSAWSAWLAKGTLAVVDQGFISGSNFLMGILLARWLTPAEYGAYALAFAIFLLLSLAYQALLLEPMSVFGPAAYRDRLHGYLRGLLWMHAAIALATLVILGVSTWIVSALGQSPTLPGALAGVTIAGPCVLLLWLARRLFYVKLAPRAAAGGAVFYSLLLLAGLWAVFRLGRLSPASAFLLMGLAALGTSTALLIRFKSQLGPDTSRVTFGEVAREHWRYGRWALASSAVIWVPNNIYFMFIGTFSGMVAEGQYKALDNLSTPIGQGFAALSLLFLPYASHTIERDGVRGMAAFARRIVAFFAAGVVVYWSLICVFRGAVLHFLYKGIYSPIGPLVPWMALGSVFWIVSQAPSIPLRAMKSPYLVFVSYSAASVITVLVGLPATWIFGLRGAVMSTIATGITPLVVSAVLLRRKIREGENGAKV